MAAFNGPGNPNDQSFLQAEVTVSASGPNLPNDQLQAATAHPANAGTGAAPAAAPQPVPHEVQTLAVKLQIARPQPFSVYLTSPIAEGVTLISVEVHIFDRTKDVSHTIVAHGQPLPLEAGNHTHIFPLTEQQLAKLLPHLTVGNVVQVKIKYFTPKPGELTIGIISREHHHILGHVIEHLLHSVHG